MSRLIDADAIGLNDFEIIMCDGDYKEALKMLLNKIETAPTVEERKVGKWIEKLKEEYQTFCECVCSNCGVVEYFNNGWKRFNYCPVCGAKMEGGKDE